MHAHGTHAHFSTAHFCRWITGRENAVARPSKAEEMKRLSKNDNYIGKTKPNNS